MKKILIASLLLSIVSLASAQTQLWNWRFGDSDPGASAGNTVTGLTRDTLGGVHLTVAGSPTYSADTPLGSSSLSILLHGAGEGLSTTTNPSLSSGNTYFIEMWFKPTSGTNSSLLYYNGDASFSGFGLYLSGTTLSFLRGGLSDQTVGTVNVNAWNYAALVYDGGANVSRVYLNNGTTATYTGTAGFNSYTGHTGDMSVANSFNGYVDTASLYAFTSGTFSTSMLNYATPVPEPSTYAALAGLAALGLVAWRRRTARA